MPYSGDTFTIINNFVDQYNAGQKKIRADLVDANFTDIAAGLSTVKTSMQAVATAGSPGRVRLATQAQAEAGTEDGAYAMTPLRTSQHLNAQFPEKFIASLAAQTSAESAANKIPQADGNGKLAVGWLPAATSTQPGVARLTSTPSADDESAAITPKGVHDTVVAHAGKVTLRASRRDPGRWTITGLTPGSLVFIIHHTNDANWNWGQIRPISGCTTAGPGNTLGAAVGWNGHYASSNALVYVMTSTVLELDIVQSPTTTSHSFHCYQ